MKNLNKILNAIKSSKSITFIKLFKCVEKNLKWNYKIIDILDKFKLNLIDICKSSKKKKIEKNYKNGYKSINIYIKKIFKILIKKNNIKLIKYITSNLKKNHLNNFLINFKYFKCNNFFKDEVYKVVLKKNKFKYIKLIFNNVLISNNNINIILKIYKLLYKIYYKINQIKYKLYDIFFNLSKISIIRFNFYFFYYGCNLHWLLNLSDLKSFNNKFIKIYKNVIKKYENRLKNIQKSINIKLIDFMKFFDHFTYLKFKIENNRDDIIKINLSIVKNYCKIYFNSKLYLDYIQEGNIGLIKAVNTYNLDYKLNFKNYIIINIRCNINKFLYKNTKLFKIPRNVSKNLKKINNILKKYKIKYNDVPSLKYISKEIYIKNDKLIKIININNMEKSLDRNIDNIKLLDFIENKDESYKIENFLMKNDLIKNIKSTFNILNKNEIEVLNSRFNLNKRGYFTLLEIGKKLNLSKERIRQIQNEALTKIKKKCSNLI